LGKRGLWGEKKGKKKGGVFFMAWVGGRMKGKGGREGEGVEDTTTGKENSQKEGKQEGEFRCLFHTT